MSNIKCMYLIAILYTSSQISSSKYVTRETINGKIRGFVTKRASNISVEQYLGIAYASPPVGNLRFEYPKQPKSWKNTLDVLTIPPACPQFLLEGIQFFVPGFSNTSEDCLYLNVYVPQIQTNESFPVLIYVHGGSNIWGMGAVFDGDVLAGNGQIIIVTFNYRLGFLGFAAAKDRGLEGAYGLFDQMKAMDWVKSNIKYFGGNPDRVTIHGHSAGAVDVGLHLVSPLSKGLFRQAIIHSQSPLSTIAITKPEWKPGYNNDDVNELCPENENKPLKLCLQSLPIANLSQRYGKQTTSIGTNFPVTVDGQFLRRRPEELFSEGKFNGDAFLLSFTNAEMAEAVYRRYYYNYLIKETIQYTVQRIMSDEALSEHCFLRDMILQQYNLSSFNDKSSSFSQLTQVLSDYLFVAPMIQMANILANWTDKVYVSRFDEPILWDHIPDDLGTSHERDLFYIFGTPFVGHKNFLFTEKDKEISLYMMKLYSNFVKYGFLTEDSKTKYKIYSTDSKIVNNIKFDKNGVVVENIYNYNEEIMKFWNYYLANVSEEHRTSSCNSGYNVLYSKYHRQHLHVILLFLFIWLFLK